MAEYIWIDGSNGMRSKTKVRQPPLSQSCHISSPVSRIQAQLRSSSLKCTNGALFAFWDTPAAFNIGEPLIALHALISRPLAESRSCYAKRFEDLQPQHPHSSLDFEPQET